MTRILDALGISLMHIAVAVYALSWLTILLWVVYAGGDPEWYPGGIAALTIGAIHCLLD